MKEIQKKIQWFDAFTLSIAMVFTIALTTSVRVKAEKEAKTDTQGNTKVETKTNAKAEAAKQATQVEVKTKAKEEAKKKEDQEQSQADTKAKNKPISTTETAPAPATTEAATVPTVKTAESHPPVATETAPKTDENIELVKVTGSRIKRIDMEGPSPVVVVDREAMEKTGYNSVADVLRDMTVNSFGSGRETAGSTAPGTASVSLRGLGATRTLVLVDGKRVPKDSITQAADLNLVPFAAVDRIEILKDSASAIYGSDALGGVVNIITRKNFTGTEVSLKQLVSQEKGGNQTEVSVTSGYSRDKLTVTGVLYHRNNQMIYARDRDHAKLGLSRTGSPGTFRTLKPNSSGDGYEPYTLDDGKTTAPQSRLQAAPGCPENRILDILGGQVCQFNYADHMSMRPRISQTSAMINSDFKVVDGLNTFVRMGATLRNVDWVYAPTPAGPTSGLGVSGAHAKTYIPGAEDPNGLNQAFANLQDTDFVDIRYRLLELGNRISKVATRQYSTLAGTTVEVGTSWEIEFVHKL